MKDWISIIAREAEVSPIALEYGWDDYRNRVAETGLIDDMDQAINYAIDEANEITKWLNTIEKEMAEKYPQIDPDPHITEAIYTWNDWICDEVELPLNYENLKNYVEYLIENWLIEDGYDDGNC